MGYGISKKNFLLPSLDKDIVLDTSSITKLIRNILTVFNDLFASFEAGFSTGAIIAWPSTTVPEGFYECDGSAKSRTTDKKLYNIIGTDYGVGDGTTTFNLPGCVRATGAREIMIIKY